MNGCQPWSVDGCTWPGCGSEQTVTLSLAGRRCAAHPPTFDPAWAVQLMVDGFPDTAAAYCRSGLPLAAAALPRPRDPLQLSKPLVPWASKFAETWGGAA